MGVKQTWITVAARSVPKRFGTSAIYELSYAKPIGEHMALVQRGAWT